MLKQNSLEAFNGVWENRPCRLRLLAAEAASMQVPSAWTMAIENPRFQQGNNPFPLHSSLMYLQFRYLKWQLITVLGEWDWSILIYKVWEPLFAETLQKVKRPGPVPNAHLATPVDQHPHPYSCWLKASLCWWLSPCLRLFKPLFPAGPHAHFCFQVFPCLFL